MIDNIFNLIESGELSDGEALMALFILHFGPTSEDELKRKLGKKSRSISSYYKKLVSKRIISKQGNVFKVQNFALIRQTDITNNQLKSKNQSINQTSDKSKDMQNIAEIHAEICKILSKIGKAFIADAILPDIELAIANNPTYPFNAEVFANIVTRVETLYTSGKIKKFVPYLKASIANSWATESADLFIQKKSQGHKGLEPEYSIPDLEAPSINIPTASPEASMTWKQIVNEIKQVIPAIKVAQLRCVFPMSIKDGILYLWVDNDFDRKNFEEMQPMVTYKLMQRNLRFTLAVENSSLKKVNAL